MKKVLYCDDFLYQKLFMKFPKFDDKGRVIGSIFSVEESENYHIVDKKYINIVLNVVDGLKDIELLVVQKSWYSDRACLNLCKYFKLLHPESKLVFIMDKGIEGHEYFLHRIATEKLAYAITDLSELENLRQTNYSISQVQFELNGMKKRKFKKLEKEFYSS